MKKVKIPLRVNPIKDAQRRLDYKGYYDKKQLQRLATLTYDVLTDININLSFKIDIEKLVVMEGQVFAEVELACQRCGGIFKQKLESNFCYSPVLSIEQIDRLSEAYEPMECDQFGEIDLVGLIEDELILMLPISPMHKIENCEITSIEQAFGDIVCDLPQKQNPFSVLANFKRK